MEIPNNVIATQSHNQTLGVHSYMHLLVSLGNAWLLKNTFLHVWLKLQENEPK